MFKKRILSAAAFLEKNAGRIAYYCAVAVVLAALSVAAEHHRNEAPAELVLPAAELEAAVQEIIAGPVIIKPENMEILRGCSNLPDWNAQLGQWEAHPATDYRISDGIVRSISDGMVRTIGRSGVYGGFVEVESGDLLFRYASIQPDSELEAGEYIPAGEILGAAANGTPGEQNLEEHLHLELYENGESIDFEGYMLKNRQNTD